MSSDGDIQIDDLPEFLENSDEKKEQKGKKEKHTRIRKDCSFLCYAYLAIAFCFLELVLRLCLYGTLPKGTGFAMLFAMVAGGLFTLLSILFRERWNRIIFYLVLSAATLYFLVQLIYFTVFHRFLSFHLAAAVGTDVLEFRGQIFDTLAARWYGVVLLLFPLAIRIVLDVLGYGFERKRGLGLAIAIAAVGGVFLGTLLLMLPGKEKVGTAGNLYYEEWESNEGTKKLGLFVAGIRDLRQTIFGEDPNDSFDILVPNPEDKTPGPPTGTEDDDQEHPISSEDEQGDPSGSKDEQGSEEGGDGQGTQGQTPEDGEDDHGGEEGDTFVSPYRGQYHELYDFAALAKDEKDPMIQKLHTYFASEEAEPTNEYTGMFEGYNLIMLTAEGFSPLAIDEELTPTLYMLTHTGFVFENFYTTLWYTSTSDGEFAACTGLVPNGANSMTRTAKNDMRFAFGHQFHKLGYKTLAFHNHTFDYYHRDLTHKNLGYDYKGIGNGLTLPTSCWPRSDDEMLRATLPEYIGDEPFHVYYMTVSGHMSYTFKDNSMATRNKSTVSGLPYSEEARGYIACNLELEKALTYLIDELSKAGIADRTVIALSADHYPYGLPKESIDELAGHEVEENFELFKNTFILWNAGMKEPVHVKKYCSSIDIAPTIANLFHLPYDSRLYAGTDIFSKKEGLVVLYNKSFITDQCSYNSTNGEVLSLTGATISRDYVDERILEVKKRFAFSKEIVDRDYFSYLPE